MSRNPDELRSRVRRRENPWANVVVGLTVLTVGVAFWLDHLGRLDAGEILHWWPAAVIALGLAQLPQRQWMSALIWTAFGVIFLLPLLGYPSVSVLRVLSLTPLFFAILGAVLIKDALRSRTETAGFQAVAVMAGNVRRFGAQEFTGGDALAVMGGCELDLTAATLKEEASIAVTAFWGGIEILVPRGWRVVMRATTLLGGLVDSTEGAPEGAPRLVIDGSIIMGGVEVKHGKEIRR